MVFCQAHLRRILTDYAAYYNGVRTHLALGKDAPVSRPVQSANPGGPGRPKHGERPQECRCPHIRHSRNDGVIRSDQAPDVMPRRNAGRDKGMRQTAHADPVSEISNPDGRPGGPPRVSSCNSISATMLPVLNGTAIGIFPVQLMRNELAKTNRATTLRAAEGASLSGLDPLSDQRIRPEAQGASRSRPRAHRAIRGVRLILPLSAPVTTAMGLLRLARSVRRGPRELSLRPR